jgi:tripeptide aminopeptidase
MGEITLHGEVRSMHQEELDQNTNQIKTIFEQIAHKNNIEVTINVVQENGGYIYEQSDPDLQHVVSTMARLGLTPVIKQDWGVADSNIFTDHGIKAINLGDGCEFTHTTREQVRISDMERLKELIMELISS